MRAVLIAASLCSTAVSAAAQTPGPDPGPLTIARQGSFFIGGREVKSDTLSTLPAYAASGTITVDQMYVRYQIPTGTPGIPVTLIHGCCLTGKTWETTPDGRMGWDEYFVRHSHPTYVIDQVWRGRSAAARHALSPGRPGGVLECRTTTASISPTSCWIGSGSTSPRPDNEIHQSTLYLHICKP